MEMEATESSLVSTQLRKSAADSTNGASMTSGSLAIETKMNGNHGKSLPENRSKSPAAVSLSRRHAAEDDGSVVSSYSRRSTVSKTQGSGSAQKPAQRGSSNVSTPSKPATSNAAGRSSTPNKLSSTSGANMKTPSKPQTSVGGMTTPTSGLRKSMGDSNNNSAPGSRSSSANRSRGSSTTTATTSTTGNAEKRLYNHDNTRRLSGASAVSSSTTTTSNGKAASTASRPAAPAVNGVRAVSRSAALTNTRTSTSAAGASMKSPPEKGPARAPSAQRSSISAPSSAIKPNNVNNTARASMSSTSTGGDRSQSVNRNAPASSSTAGKRSTSTTGRSRGAEPVVVPSANLLRSSTTATDTRGSTTPNKAAAVRRPSLGGSGPFTASLAQHQRAAAIKTEPIIEPKTEDLQKNMQTLARKFAALKVKTPIEEDETSELDTSISVPEPLLVAKVEVSNVIAPSTAVSKPRDRSPLVGRLSRSNSGSSANGNTSAAPSASSFMLSSAERKHSTSPIMVRAGSATNILSPSSQSSSTPPFHRTGSASQMIAPNTDRVLRSYDEIGHAINSSENNGSGGIYGGANQSNSNSSQNLISVPLKIRLEFPARQILPPEPVVYMECLQHSTPVAIQAIYRAASVSANSSPAHKANQSNSASGTPKSLGGSGKKKSGW